MVITGWMTAQAMPEQGLLVFHFDIAPDHEEDQFAVDPQVAQIQRGKPLEGLM